MSEEVRSRAGTSGVVVVLIRDDALFGLGGAGKVVREDPRCWCRGDGVGGFGVRGVVVLVVAGCGGGSVG